MTILREALESLIREAWNKEKIEKEREMFNSLPLEDQIAYAIKNVRRIHFKYDDEQGGGGKNYRYILPVAMGESKAGNLVFRAFQTMGSTKRGNRKWKLFRVDRVKTIHDWDFNLSTRNFKSYKEQLDALGLHNPDKGMKVIYEVSPLCSNQDIPVADIDKPIDSNPISKADVQNNSNVHEPTSDVKTVDNSIQKPDTVNRLEAPETKPITKVDVQPDIANDVQEPQQDTEQPVMSAPADEPVMKQDIESGSDTEGISRDNELTRSYNDLMNRMDNLYKDEDEKEYD